MSPLPRQDPDFWASQPLWLLNPAAVYSYFIKLRWKGGKFCPYCKHNVIYHLSVSGMYKCAKCKKTFSTTVGTIFEGTKILYKYVLAIAILCDRNGKIGSTELAKLTGVSQPSAWMMLKRLREASLTPSFNEPLLPQSKSDRTAASSSRRRLAMKGDPQYKWREAERRSKNEPGEALKQALTRPHRVAAAKRLVSSPQFSLIFSGDRREHEEVEDCLKRLHRARELAGGPHPSDANRAVALLKPLIDRGYRIDPAACRLWVEAHDWEDFEALELAAIIEELSSTV